MVPRHPTSRPWIAAAVIATVLFAAALGFCVFETGHAGHGDHGMALDLCTGLALVLPSIALIVRPLLGGWAPVKILSTVSVASIHLPDPPPKLVPLS